VIAAACDKLKGAVAGGDAPAFIPADALDLTTNPDILFQVFGERSEPRILPLAALIDGTLKPIYLAPDGWRQFAALYEKKGTRYRLYDDGRDIGSITIRQGMWDNPNVPLYSLPNCSALLPIAAVKLETKAELGFTVDLLATSARLAPPGARPAMPEAEIRRLGRELGHIVGESQGIPSKALEGLNFRAFAVNTGATARPTIIASFIDPTGGTGEDGESLGHVFVIADVREDGAYVPTFSHAFAGSTAGAEYRIYLNHLDLTGDGIQELVLEARLTRGGSYVAVLSYQNGGWQETFQSRSNWCLDERRR
jgi:hypothetical protein